MYVRIYIHTYIYTYIHTYMGARSHTHTHTQRVMILSLSPYLPISICLSIPPLYKHFYVLFLHYYVCMNKYKYKQCNLIARHPPCIYLPRKIFRVCLFPEFVAAISFVPDTIEAVTPQWWLCAPLPSAPGTWLSSTRWSRVSVPGLCWLLSEWSGLLPSS